MILPIYPMSLNIQPNCMNLCYRLYKIKAQLGETMRSKDTSVQRGVRQLRCNFTMTIRPKKAKDLTLFERYNELHMMYLAYYG